VLVLFSACQEVSGAFIAKADGKDLSKKYFDVYFPQELDGDRDQNSLILLKKGAFANVHEVATSLREGDGWYAWYLNTAE